MANISKWVIPPGGWVYYQGAVKLEEPTADALISAVHIHRRNNGLDIGNPEEDVLSQIESRKENPQFMTSPPESLWGKFKSMAGSVLRSYTRDGGQLLDQNTANIRAMTCLGCHANQRSDGDCKACGGFVEDAAVTALRPLVVGNRSVTNGALLKSCGICGCDLKMIVWFPSKTLGNTPENINRFPTFCWQKNLDV